MIFDPVDNVDIASEALWQNDSRPPITRLHDIGSRQDALSLFIALWIIHAS